MALIDKVEDLRNRTGGEWRPTLLALADLLDADPRAWSRGAMYRDEHGIATNNPHICESACLAGLVQMALGGREFLRARDGLKSVITRADRDIEEQNDDLEDAAEIADWIRLAAGEDESV